MALTDRRGGYLYQKHTTTLITRPPGISSKTQILLIASESRVNFPLLRPHCSPPPHLCIPAVPVQVSRSTPVLLCFIYLHVSFPLLMCQLLETRSQGLFIFALLAPDIVLLFEEGERKKKKLEQGTNTHTLSQSPQNYNLVVFFFHLPHDLEQIKIFLSFSSSSIK